VIYCEVGGAKYELINPQFTQMSDDTFWLWDDCFSFPNLLVWLERARRVRLRYQTAGGATREIEAEAAMAELLQHEMDHLDGVLAVDHARGPHSLSTRAEWLRRKGAPPEAPVRPGRQGLG
jgi:peptide deformylase